MPFSNVTFLSFKKLGSPFQIFFVISGCTPAVYAVQGGCLACVRYLVEKARADLGCLTSKGQSLLHVAALSGQFNVAKWLLQQMGTQAALWQTLDSATCVHCAACE